MIIVRFAMLCDKCQRHSEEYGCWPTCRECGEVVCDGCDLTSQRTEDERNSTLCIECHLWNEAEERERTRGPQTLADVGMCEADFR